MQAFYEIIVQVYIHSIYLFMEKPYHQFLYQAYLYLLAYCLPVPAKPEFKNIIAQPYICIVILEPSRISYAACIRQGFPWVKKAISLFN
jgi:hypothetical protein